MKNRKIHKTVAALALLVPFTGGAALAGDMHNKQSMEMKDKSYDASKKMEGTGGTGTMGADAPKMSPHMKEMSCGEKIASQAATAKKSAELLTSIAEGYSAHAESLVNAKGGKAERQLLQKTAATYKDMAKRFNTMSAQLEEARTVKDAEHEMSAEVIEKMAQQQLKTAQLQKELGMELQREADEMRAMAEQMRNQAVGGSGSSMGGSGSMEQPEQMPQQMPEQMPEQEQEAWPPMPERPTQ